MEVSSVGVGFAAKITADPKETKVLLEDFSSELKDVQIQHIETTHPIFLTHKLTIEGGILDPDAQTATVSRVALQGGAIDVSRNVKGQINWQNLFALKKEAAQVTIPTAVKELKLFWNYRIKTFEVGSFDANLSDLGINPDKPILNIQSFACRLTDVDGKSPMDFEAGFSLKQGGTVSVRGKVDPSTPSVEASLNLKALSLTPLQPQFMTRIIDLKGRVSGLTSAGDSPSQIQLDGRVDQYGLARISGKINVFHPELSTDLSLGEHIDSPSALNLPLDLAIAVLRDSNGRIDIGLPVTGDLNDPSNRAPKTRRISPPGSCRSPLYKASEH